MIPVTNIQGIAEGTREGWRAGKRTFPLPCKVLAQTPVIKDKLIREERTKVYLRVDLRYTQETPREK